jgi:hypothetical protein
VDVQHDPPALLFEDSLLDNLPLQSIKRGREDENIQYIDEIINSKRMRLEADTIPQFTVSSPELQIQFPDLENELLSSSSDTIYTPTTYDHAVNIDITTNFITLEGDWFLPNSPICEFDSEPVAVPDSDFSYPPLSELPYFENTELLIQETDNPTITTPPTNSSNNPKESTLLDNEDTQFWSLLAGEGDNNSF